MEERAVRAGPPVCTVPDRDPSFARLVYRYWFFGWLFRDAGRGSRLEREAALRHNRERARWLPTYIRRWVVLGTSCYTIGAGLEWLGLHTIAPVAFLPACLAASVLAVASVGWLMLNRLRRADVAFRRRDP